MPPGGAVHDWILLRDPLCLAPGTVIGIAFLALWWRERGAHHQLWWGLASLLGAAGTSLLPVTHRLLAEPGWPARVAAALLILASLSYWIGARARCGRALRPRRILGLVAGLLGLFLFLNLFATQVRVVALDVVIAIGFLGCARLLWPLGASERVAALLLLARALNPAVLTVVIDGYEMLERGRINQTLAFAVGLLLITGAFLRSAAELRALRGSLAVRVAEATRDLGAAENELAIANRELEAFTYSVSHDLRAPLRSLDGYSRMLEEDCAGSLDAGQLAALETLRREAASVAVTVDELLQFSRAQRASAAGEGSSHATREHARALLRRLRGADAAPDPQGDPA